MLEMYAGVVAEHSTLLPCFLPLTTSTMPDCYRCTVVTIRKEVPISVSSLLQWWICCAQAYDQAHEQCNAMVKGNGGAVGLAINPGSLRRWVTAGQRSLSPNLILH